MICTRPNAFCPFKSRPMKTIFRWLTIACVVVTATSVFAAKPKKGWHIADGPLLTKWSHDVNPRHPWPEYPRPQMERKDWMNLNGLWDYAILEKKEGLQAPYQGKILVPYPIESALSGVMKRVNDNEVLMYHRTFRIPAKWKGERVLLHFGAVDWETVVVVNGKRIGEHRGGYDPFSFDITDALQDRPEQDIEISVYDPTDAGGQPRGKQVNDPKGIYYTPSSGIWQTVWLEPVPRAHIADFKVTPDVDSSSLRITVNATGGDLIEAIAYSHGREVGRETGDPGKEFRIRIDNPVLWSPRNPHLYDLRINLLKGFVPRGGKDGVKYGENFREIDRVKSYFAMRKITLAKDEQGIMRPMMNDRFIFQVGPLDQGFWPDGLYTPPTDKAMLYDLQMTKDLGFNMTRKHVKVEPDRWYYYCDKMGLLVWQDMPSANNKTPADKAEFEKELHQLVEAHYNHPCIYMWVVFNEGWGQYDTERLTGWVKKMDPSRLVDNATGWTDMKCGDVIDMHNYPGPGSPQPEANRAAVLGEFGGLGLGIDHHTWAQQTWGYQGMSDRAGLTRRYVNLLRKAWALEKKPGLSAVVYTQITDVETECNGLMTYDRAIVKPDIRKVAAANRGHVPPEPKHTLLLPTSKQQPAVWKYTFQNPDGGRDARAPRWAQPDFNDSDWQQGEGGFGTEGTPGAAVHTKWNTPDIWIRRDFELPPGKYDETNLLVHHDEDAEIFINGQLATKLSNYSVEYGDEAIRSRALNALHPGKNTIAVHCHNASGGQYIDVGLEKIGE
jgi:hypothetical protein